MELSGRMKRQRLMDVVKEDIQWLGVTEDDAGDRARWDQPKEEEFPGFHSIINHIRKTASKKVGKRKIKDVKADYHSEANVEFLLSLINWSFKSDAVTENPLCDVYKSYIWNLQHQSSKKKKKTVFYSWFFRERLHILIFSWTDAVCTDRTISRALQDVSKKVRKRERYRRQESRM